MDFAAVAFLAFAMSTDAFAAAVGKGAQLHQPKFSHALKIGLIFGLIEGTTPVVGWALGQVAAPYIKAWDHWIAFTLLCGLGLLMIRDGCKPLDGVPAKRVKHSFWLLAITGLATSIDAMAVGVGLAFLNVDIIAVAVAIGLTTTVMVTLGVMLGRVLSVMAGRRAGIVGGVILIGVGSAILFQHLSGAA